MKPALLDAIQQRYACHDFIADQPVTTDELAVLLEAGRLAPSAFGLEPWRFVTVTETAEKAALAHACFDQPAATSAAAFIVVVALVDKLEPDSDYVRVRFQAEARGQDVTPIHDTYRHFYHADSIADWAQGQCNYAAAHILLQAAHLGIGSCPIGGFDTDALATTLSVENGDIPTLVIALGHCRHVAPERIRKPLDTSS